MWVILSWVLWGDLHVCQFTCVHGKSGPLIHKVTTLAGGFKTELVNWYSGGIFFLLHLCQRCLRYKRCSKSNLRQRRLCSSLKKRFNRQITESSRTVSFIWHSSGLYQSPINIWITDIDISSSTIRMKNAAKFVFFVVSFFGNLVEDRFCSFVDK